MAEKKRVSHLTELPGDWPEPSPSASAQDSKYGGRYDEKHDEKHDEKWAPAELPDNNQDWSAYATTSDADAGGAPRVGGMEYAYFGLSA